jgi:beta-glucosidase-like glycosyl hydrolase
MKDTWGREIIVEMQHCTDEFPRGNGNYKFHFGGYVFGDDLSIDFTFSGLFSEAKKAALKEAAKTGCNLVVVCD